jgi:hypothetical protein
MKHDEPFENLAPWLSEASDASPSLRAFLREASTNPPDAARVERLRQRLGPWLGATSPPAAPPASSGAVGSTVGAVGKAGLWAVVGTLIGGGVWLVLGGPSRAEPAPLRSASVESPSPRAPVSPAATPLSPAATPLSPAATPLSPAATPSSALPSAPRAAKAGRGRSLPSGRQGPPSLAEEAAALAAAQRALASSPSRSLALLQEHAQKFPRSALAEERCVFTIEALVALSRSEEARRELARLELGYPSSAHLGKARRLVGIDASPQ